MSMMRNVVWAATLVLMSCMACYPQDRGAITGTVTDPAGAMVAGAAVKATNAQTGRIQETVSTSTGMFSLEQLPAGTYKVIVRKDGFKTGVAENVSVLVNTSTRLDFTMSIGSLIQTVEIKAAPAMLQSDRTDLGMRMKGETILELPLGLSSGMLRENTQFTLLAPGASNSSGMDSNNDANHYNGGLGVEQSQLLDGGESQSTRQNDPWFLAISVDAVEEFKLMTNAYSAEYGRSGNGIENFTSKSGTNHYHGSLFEYVRNEKFESRGFFDVNRPENKQNEYGGSVGGPVYIPKVFNGRDKLFFFFNTDRSDYRGAGGSGLQSLPTQAMRQGDFTGWVDSRGHTIPIYDPATTTTVNGLVTRSQINCNGALNVICSNREDPTAATLWSLLPEPTLPGLTNNYPISAISGGFNGIWSLKIDWNKGTKSHLSSYFSHYHSGAPIINGPFPGPLGNNNSGLWNNKFFRLNYDYIFSPTILNHVLVSANWVRQTNYSSMYFKGPSDTLTPDQQKAIQIKGIALRPNDPSTYSEGDGYVGLNANNDSSLPMRTHQLNDTLTILHGRHSLKIGYEYIDQIFGSNNYNNYAGSATFAASVTGLPSSSATTGSSIAAMFLGLPSSVSYTLGDYTHMMAPAHDFFIQDDIKLTRKLTINAGLRYDYQEPVEEGYGNWSSVCLTCVNAAAGGLKGAMEFAGNGPGRVGGKRFTQTRKNAFGPRLGIAYQVTPNTVFRAGGGIFYLGARSPNGGNDKRNGFGGSQSVPQPNGYTPATTLAAGVPAVTTPPPIVDPGICTLGYTIGPTCGPGVILPYAGLTPRMGSWNGTVEHRFGTSTLLRVAYAGNAGVHQGGSLENINQMDPKYLSLGSLLLQPMSSSAVKAAGFTLPYPSFPTNRTLQQALKPYPQYSSLTESGDSDKSEHSTYNSMQISLERQMSKGLWAQASYTWAKTIASSEADSGVLQVYAGGQGSAASQNQYNRLADKSVASSDLPHILSLGWVYNLPVGRGKSLLSNSSAVVNGFLGGWRVSGIQHYQSGNPLWVTSSQTNALGSQELRPNMVPGQALKNPAWTGDPNAKGSNGLKIPWINPAAFSRPALYTLGNAPRVLTNLRNARYRDEDFALAKDFPLWSEQRRLTFTADAINLFNRHVWGSPYGLGTSPDMTLEDTAFGVISGEMSPRREVQFNLRLTF